ncbi:MAG: protease family protein [Pseudonocardiales bacterium]|nr:protease family protein [Pseudonocardiales bacterium]
MTTSGVGARPDDARPSVLSRHPLVFFFLIAFAGAWLLELPVVLSRTGTGLLPYTLPRVVVILAIAAATFTGPTLSAFVMARATEGQEGPKRLLRRYAQWRVKLRWYLFVLLAIPASEVLGAIVLPVAPLFPAPLLNDYGLLPELVGFGAVAVIVVAATRGRLSLHDERRSQESDPAALPP